MEWLAFVIELDTPVATVSMLQGATQNLRVKDLRQANKLIRGAKTGAQHYVRRVPFPGILCIVEDFMVGQIEPTEVLKQVTCCSKRMKTCSVDRLPPCAWQTGTA